MPRSRITRRRALAGGLAGAATIVGCTDLRTREEPIMTERQRMPVAYIPHGGGPWPFVDIGMDRAEHDALAVYLRGLAKLPATKPSALLVVSAHWEQRVPTLMTSAKPPMLYDYSGFPAASYELQWPAPGSPTLATRTQSLLTDAGFETAVDDRRGFDHGTFVPLMLTYPEAEIPTLQLSLVAGLDPAQHLALGRALAPLRDEGVFIVGSGMSYHNMRGFRDPQALRHSVEFDEWLTSTAASSPADRDGALVRWSEAPSARASHPREEHLLPLMVVAGAAGDDPGHAAFRGQVFGKQVSAIHFG
jgi:aromatic ring-opening dioxygenase catalytic subunit (LigB family)